MSADFHVSLFQLTRSAVSYCMVFRKLSKLYWNEYPTIRIGKRLAISVRSLEIYLMVRSRLIGRDFELLISGVSIVLLEPLSWLDMKYSIIWRHTEFLRQLNRLCSSFVFCFKKSDNKHAKQLFAQYNTRISLSYNVNKTLLLCRKHAFRLQIPTSSINLRFSVVEVEEKTAHSNHYIVW